MIGPHLALAVMVLYLLLLFAIAQYADRRKLSGRSIVANPYVYALSLSVYVSAWTFYGSIGRAASTGLEFLPIYLGPVLAMTVGWIVIRKMIHVSKEHRLTSISDFISFRYGRSYAIGALVAIFSLIMVTPYVALQLIAISTSLEVLSGPQIILPGINGGSRLVVAVLLGAFAIIFGARHLDPMERHEGLIAAVAFESLIKIVAFLFIGLYVAFVVFAGYGDILDQMASRSYNYADLMDVEPTLWFSLTLISFFAILFLPRQFHVMVVENSDKRHLKKAMWLFPLYLLLFNIFVPAIAWGGRLLESEGTIAPELRDAFIIAIPYAQHQEWLALFAFIGGTSAATAMILVESVAVGTMLLNDLEMPYILSRMKNGKYLAGTLLNMRRLNILLVVFLGYLYSQAVDYKILADIGIVSFLAASQIAPAALGGLYWKGASRKGAMAGLASGFLLWAYTALIPTIARGHAWLEDLIRDGPLSISLFRPTNLFGLDLDPWSNSIFWTLLVNCSLYILVSLCCKPSSDEVDTAISFVDPSRNGREAPVQVPLATKQGKIEDLEAMLARYIGEEAAKEQVDRYLAGLKASRETATAGQIEQLWMELEKTLTGSVGPSATRMIVQDQVTVKPVVEEKKETLPAYNLVRGKIYAVPALAYDAFTDQITHGVEGLCITHRPPEEVRRSYGFKETPIIKLSDEKGSDRYISPRNLPLLFMTIKSFVEFSKNSVVLIDSIERLVEENARMVPERDIVDFVYQIELLGSRTRLILAERQKFVHIGQGRTEEIVEIRELLFSLGPLSAYLFQVFSEAMLSPLSKDMREEATAQANEMIASGAFFDVPSAMPEDRSSPPNDSPAGCEPEMQAAVQAGSTLIIPRNLVLSRRSFFMAVRRLARIIKQHQPSFDLSTELSDLMKSYGRSPYELSLIPGTTYIISEEKPQRSMELFSDLVAHGMDGLCLSRYNPQVLQERYNVPVETVIWLTQKSEPGYRTVDPSNFPRLSGMISDFLGRANYPVILLEGMGYLITQSNYETVLRFVQSQRDEIALKSAIMLVHIDPLSLDTKELHRLGSEMEPL